MRYLQYLLTYKLRWRRPIKLPIPFLRIHDFFNPHSDRNFTNLVLTEYPILVFIVETGVSDISKLMAVHEEAPEISEAEAALYDRQIRLWGLDAQRRLRAANVFLAGIKGNHTINGSFFAKCRSH